MYVMGGTVLAFGLVETGIFLSWSALQEAERKLTVPEPMMT